MTTLQRITRRLKLRHLLFLVLLGLGIVPVTVSNVLSVLQNREILETEQKTYLTRSSESLSRELNESLRSIERELGQIGTGLLVTPGPEVLEERLRQPWVGPFLQSYFAQSASFETLRVLDLAGAGPRLSRAGLDPGAEQVLDAAFDEAAQSGQNGRGKDTVYRFVTLPGNQPGVVMALAVGAPGQPPAVVVEALAHLRLIEAVFRREAERDVGMFLVGRKGELLWSQTAPGAAEQTIVQSSLVQDFVRAPDVIVNVTSEYQVRGDDGRRQRVIARISPVEETGWGVVVHKPAASAFAAAREMVTNTLLSTGVLVVLALLSAILVARVLSQPIARLASTTHQIAAGNFGQRVEEGGIAAETAILAEDFNRMVDHVQAHIRQLEQAARENQELFVGSIRAFAAAIDAKDPYTRGHSERVALYSRTIARQMGLGDEMLHRIWIGALLHDVGKIGIDDKVLKKGGVLTNEEYDQMKQHPVIGEQILKPIEQLREMLPAVRWHHESWNGRGYPDNLRGEEIPLMARIVGVADTFDAITTNRPYQRAYTPQFAVETITKLTGTKFDAKVTTAFLRAFQSGEIEVPTAPPVEAEPVREAV